MIPHSTAFAVLDAYGTVTIRCCHLLLRPEQVFLSEIALYDA